MGFFNEYSYLNLSQNWPKYRLLDCNPAWKCSMSSQYWCSHSWGLYGHLIQPGFFFLLLCILTAGVRQNAKSKTLVQSLSITAFRMLHGEATSIMSYDLSKCLRDNVAISMAFHLLCTQLEQHIWSLFFHLHLHWYTQPFTQPYLLSCLSNLSH